MGNRVTADVTEYDDAWTHIAYARRQWGLVADQRPSTHPVAGNGRTTSGALQDFDGISYAKGSSILKRLNTMLGDEVFFAGAVDHFTTHRSATPPCTTCSRLGEGGRGRPLSFTGNWLRTAGPDTIVLDRAAGVVRRTSADHPADCAHTIQVATASPLGSGRSRRCRCRARRRCTGDGAAVVLDPYEDSPALVQPDPATVAALKALLPRPTTPGCGPGSGTTCAARSTTPPWTRQMCSTCSRPASRWRTTTTRSSRSCRGRRTRSRRSPPTPTRCGGSMPRRWRRCTPLPRARPCSCPRSRRP